MKNESERFLSIFDHMPATRAFFRWVLMAGEKRP